jgi:DNA-binding CsgD family transcriptional regulator
MSHPINTFGLSMQKGLPIQVTAELTEREQEILRLLATGTSNKEIARHLFISSNTVKVHLHNIFAKIGVASRTEAAMYAVQIGLVRSPAASEQDDGNPAQAGSILAASQTTAVEVPPRPLAGVRQASVAAVVVIFMVLVGVGIMLTRQQANKATNTSQAIPTPESRWQVLASLPTARGGLAVTAYENQVYAIGGDTVQGVTGLVERFDPATDSWVELSRKPVPVTDVNAAVIGGKIYVPGGRTSSDAATDALEIYDPRQDTWGKGSNLPVAMSAYAMAAFEGRLYLFGGWNGKKYLNSVFIYDPGQDHWASLASMPEARGFASAAVAGDKIYVIGGYDGKQALKINEVYSPFPDDSKSPWSQAAPMPDGRYAFGMASIADAIYILGGKGENKGLPSSLVYIPQTAKWQAYESPPVNIGNDVRLTPLGQYLYALGGNTDNGTTGHNLIYQAIFTIMIPIVP